jgi:hypothetical protein
MKGEREREIIKNNRVIRDNALRATIDKTPKEMMAK